MAFPTLVQFISPFVALAVGVPVVYLLSKTLKLGLKPRALVATRKEVPLVFLVIIATFVVTSAMVVLSYTVVRPAFQLDERQPFTVDYIDVLWTAFGYAAILLPLTMAMKKTGQDVGSSGINGKDKWRMLALGIILSAILMIVEGFLASSMDGGFAGFSPSQVYGFTVYAIVGFSEEIVYRGYIQTRLVAFSGKLKGLVATSLIFALWHFPVRYFQFSGVALEALASALLIFPSGLLLGYIMLRSQNIVPSSVFHLFANWSALFWRIPTF